MTYKPQKPLDPVLLIAVAMLVLVIMACIGCSTPPPAGTPGAAPKSRAILYVVTSPYCSGCVQDYPMVEKIVGLGMVTVRVVIVEEQPQWAEDLEITRLPTYILVRDRKEIWRGYAAGEAYKEVQKCRVRL